MLLRRSLTRVNRKFSSLRLGPGIIQISAEVRHAIANNLPVVALESTIISHGMPYPRNVQVARNVEALIRSVGAIPATCAIINGVPKVGLNSADLEILANPSDVNRNGRSVLKASRRDMGYAIATQSVAATTVSGTMILAHAAGISVFATGGIGGVHRGAEHSMDVSADLTELGRTPVLVVCAGVKSILDIPKTLEVLETQGVPVVGYNCAEFPAFFTNSSGVPSPFNVSSPKVIAEMLLSQTDLNLSNGIVVGVPNPSPGDSLSIQIAIETALLCAQNDGISGFRVTPYVLAMVEKLTRGSSLDCNVALVMNNAKVAALIAIQLCDIRRARDGGAAPTPTPSSPSPSSTFPPSSSSPSSSSSQLSSQASRPSDVVIFGAAILDIISIPFPSQLPTDRTLSQKKSKGSRKGSKLVMGSSNPGTVNMGYGGVARNIAEALARLNTSVTLVSAVGDDEAGRGLVEHARLAGIDTSQIQTLKLLPRNTHELFGGEPSALPSSTSSGLPDALTDTEIERETDADWLTIGMPAQDTATTATYTATHDISGELVVAVADVRIVTALQAPDMALHAHSIAASQLVVIDGNFNPVTFASVVDRSFAANVPLFFDCTSDVKCLLPLRTGTIDKISIIKPNLSELCAIVEEALTSAKITGSARFTNKLEIRQILCQMKHKECVVDDLARLEKVESTGYLDLKVDDFREDIGDVRVEGGALQIVGMLAHCLLTMMEGNRFDGSDSGDGDSTGGGGVEEKDDSLGQHVIVTLGSNGVLWCRTIGKYRAKWTHFPAIAIPLGGEGRGHNTNGAGDAFCAGVVHHMLMNREETIRKMDLSGCGAGTGVRAAGLTLTKESIRVGLIQAHSKILRSVK